MGSFTETDNDPDFFLTDTSITGDPNHSITFYANSTSV